MPRRREEKDLVQLKVRMREVLRARLEEDAKRRGVSINAEIVYRLERAFDRVDLLGEVLALTFGSRLAGLLMVLGLGMEAAAQKTLFEKGRHFRADWTTDPDAYEQAQQAAAALLHLATPPGKRTSGTELAGFWSVTELLAALRGEKDDLELYVDTTLHLLGPIAPRMNEALPGWEKIGQSVLGEAWRGLGKQMLSGRAKSANAPAEDLSLENFAEDIVDIIKQTYRPTSSDGLSDLLERLKEKIGNRVDAATPIKRKASQR